MLMAGVTDPPSQDERWGFAVWASLAAVVLIAGLCFAVLIGRCSQPRQKPRAEEVALACRAVRRAAEIYQALGESEAHCPTLDDLVRDKKIESGKVQDLWGTRYLIECLDAGIRVISAGPDRTRGTADDIHDP